MAIQKEGLVCCILDILNVMDLAVRVISAGRHTGTKKLMRTDERFQDILHQFDPWHVGKSLLKKSIEASQKKVINLFKFLFLLKGLFSSSWKTSE